jgi:hypothetical protein
MLMASSLSRSLEALLLRERVHRCLKPAASHGKYRCSFAWVLSSFSDNRRLA